MACTFLHGQDCFFTLVSSKGGLEGRFVLFSETKQYSGPWLASPWDERRLEGLRLLSCSSGPIHFYFPQQNQLINPCCAALWSSPWSPVHDPHLTCQRRPQRDPPNMAASSLTSLYPHKTLPVYSPRSQSRPR